MSPGVSRRSRLRLAVRVGRAELEGDNLSCRQIALVFVRPVPWQGHDEARPRFANQRIAHRRLHGRADRQARPLIVSHHFDRSSRGPGTRQNVIGERVGHGRAHAAPQFACVK